MATFSDIRLMGVSDGSSELNSSTSTYKAEVERTEALQAYFNQQIINIFNELAKDDSISKSNKISQIVAGLQDIKRARKRWASGGSLPYEYKTFESGSWGSSNRKQIYYNSVNLGNIISFIPSIVIIKSNKGLIIHLNLFGNYVAIVPSHESSPNKYNPSGGYGWYWDHPWPGMNCDKYIRNYLREMTFNHRDIMVLWVNEIMSQDIKSEFKKIQIESWIAIE